MNPRLANLLSLVLILATCGAQAKHYSFVGGYPANGTRTQADRAKAVENGGISVKTSATERKTTVVQSERTLAGRVTKVCDGDTIWVTPNGGRAIKVRMNRIDAPEADQPCGDKATKFLKDLVGGKQVEVRYAERDDYGRVLGTVFCKTDKGLVDANLTMILNGWAWHYYSFRTNDKIPAYDKAEQAARNAKAGLWAQPNPVRPYDWRKKSK